MTKSNVVNTAGGFFNIIERIISIHVQIQSLIDTLSVIEAVLPYKFQFCESC